MTFENFSGSHAKIPLLDLRAAHADSALDVEQAVIEVLQSNVYLRGPQTHKFEKEWAAYCGHRHGVSTGSGTEALRLTLLALWGIGAGRTEVITVANSAPPTVLAIWLAGLTPVFVDVDAETGLMDTKKAIAAVTPKTLAIMPVHLYGNILDLDDLCCRARALGVPAIVEDCAHAHGIPARPVTPLIHVRCHSFYPTKILAACGDAGMVTTDNDDIADIVRRMTCHDLGEDGAPESVSGNSRMDEIQAAVLRARLPHLETDIDKRRKLVGLYLDHLPKSMKVLTDPDGCCHLLVVLAENRRLFREWLNSWSISTGVHYPVPSHRWAVADHLEFRSPESLVNTARLSKRVVSLPFWPGMPEQAVLRVCSALQRAEQIK